MNSDPGAPPAKPVSESQVQTVEMVLPNDTNPLGNILGGRVMHLIDITGATAAMRHARKQVVTAHMDDLSFHHPVKLGQFLILKASVNFVSKTSLEVGVKVMSEDPITGEQIHTSSAYLTFVAVDENGKPAGIPPIQPESEEERRRYKEAQIRHQTRITRRKNS